MNTDYIDILMAELDPVKYCEKYLRPNIYENQQATINAICDPSIRKVLALHARQTGKTDSVAMSCINIGERCSGESFGNILIFGPREGQAMLDIARIKTLTQFNPHYADIIDWPSCTKSVVVFKDKWIGRRREPGITIRAYSAAETANTEGESAGMMIIEEAQKVSDRVVSEVLLPMGGAWGAKIVKIGTPRHRNHFYGSFKDDTTYAKCIFPWDKCGILKRSGTTLVNGQDVSTYVLERMRKVIKQEYWPDNPMVEYCGNVVPIWDIHGDMDPDDFRTQYSLDWLIDVDQLLSEEDLLKLYGDHANEDSGTQYDQYFAGYDPAGGSLTDPNDEGKNDWSALTIIKKHPNGLKQIVFKDERYGEDYVVQMEWIKEMCDAKGGRFPCQGILIDANGCGMPVVDVLRAAMPKTAIMGIMSRRTEPNSGKDWKNAMFDYAKLEIQSGMFKYPRKDVVDGHQTFAKHYGEWTDLESKRTTSVNRIIRAPAGSHDDGPCSDVYACYIADKLAYLRKMLKQGRGLRATTPILASGLFGGGQSYSQRGMSNDLPR